MYAGLIILGSGQVTHMSLYKPWAFRLIFWFRGNVDLALELWASRLGLPLAFVLCNYLVARCCKLIFSVFRF